MPSAHNGYNNYSAATCQCCADKLSALLHTATIAYGRARATVDASTIAGTPCLRRNELLALGTAGTHCYTMPYTNALSCRRAATSQKAAR